MPLQVPKVCTLCAVGPPQGAAQFAAACREAGLRKSLRANMPFTRYVEIGRVALINYGEDYGKLVVISDVIDQNRVRSHRGLCESAS